MSKTVNKTNFDFSRYNTYKKCPLQYKWKYVERRKPKTPPNMYYALPGIVIQKLFEHFYNDEWFLKREACREYMYNKASEIYEKTLKWCYVDWQSKIAKKTKHDVYDEFLEMIGKNLDVVKEYKLLGKVAKSEHTIITHLPENNYVILKSKIDFFIKNKEHGLVILDGKATSNKKNYLDNPEQLYFYAMMTKQHYGRYPDKIGFWWWRDAKISFVDFDDSIIQALVEDISDVLYKIYKEKFEATPEYSTCLFCDYQSECTERTRHVAEKQAEKSINLTEDDLLKDFA